MLKIQEAEARAPPQFVVCVRAVLLQLYTCYAVPFWQLVAGMQSTDANHLSLSCPYHACIVPSFFAMHLATLG